MKLEKEVKIHTYHPADNNAKQIVCKLCATFEERLVNEYTERYLPMLNAGVLKKTYIIIFDDIPVGLRLLRTCEGIDFNTNRNVLKSTMFRVSPKYRNKGIGRCAFHMINKLIFKTYRINAIYSASIEFGALKLYSSMENIRFLPNQFINNVIFNVALLKSNLPNEFTFNSDIKLKILNTY